MAMFLFFDKLFRQVVNQKNNEHNACQSDESRTVCRLPIKTFMGFNGFIIYFWYGPYFEPNIIFRFGPIQIRHFLALSKPWHFDGVIYGTFIKFCVWFVRYIFSAIDIICWFLIPLNVSYLGQGVFRYHRATLLLAYNIGYHKMLFLIIGQIILP